MSLAFLILAGSPAEVIYDMPPMKTKMSATVPAIATTQLMAPMTMSLTLAHASVAQFLLDKLMPPKAIRMVLIMTLASNTMPRPMKA